MKRKAVCFVLTLLAIALFSLGCGGGGGSSNPAASNISGSARVSGVVTDAQNKPVANAKVRLSLASNALINSLSGNTNGSYRLATTGAQTEFNTVTDNKGQYTFNNVPYGEYTLSAVTANGAQIVTNLKVTAAGDVNVEDIKIMPYGSISGIVTDSSSQAISGAMVYLEGTSCCAVTGSSGEYTLNSVPVNSEFSLRAMAAGYNNSTGKSVKIIASESLELNTGNAFDTVKIILSPLSEKASVLSCTVTDTGASLSNLVFAVNQNDGTTFVGKVINSESTYKSELRITKTGTYNIFAASVGNGSNAISGIESKEINDLNSSYEVELSFVASSGNSSFASLSGTVVPADGISDSSFEVALYDSTGREHKQNVAANSTFTFRNLPADKKYALAVSSANSLYVKNGIELAEGDNKTINDEIKTIKVAPSFTPVENSCYARVDEIVETDNSLPSEVYFSVYGYDSDSNPVLLYGYDETNNKVIIASESYNASSVSGCSVCTDNCSKLGFIKFFFTNGLNKNVFEKTFASSSEIAPNNAKLSLKVDENGTTLKQSDDIILFKAIEFQSKLYYLVVTSKFTYVFDGESGNIASLSGKTGKYDFANRLKDNDGGNTLFSSIKYGNACYIPNESESSMAVQYFYDPGENSCATYYLYKYSVNDVFGISGSENRPFKKLGDIGDGYKFPVDKLIGEKTSEGKLKFYSACGKEIKIFSETTTGDVSDSSLSIELNPEVSSDAVVSTSTVLFEPSSGNKPVFYFLADDDSNVYFGKNTYDVDNNNNVVSNFLIPLGSVRNYTLTDCLDNYDAENKVFINEDYNWNNGVNPSYADPKYVYSNTIYTGSNIKSSYLKISLDSNQYLDTWIERNSSDQNLLVLRNLTSYKEKKIRIKQVLNSSAYLEGSIGFTTLNGNQIHVLCTDNSGNIQVLVVNCVNGQQ